MRASPELAVTTEKMSQLFTKFFMVGTLGRLIALGKKCVVLGWGKY